MALISGYVGKVVFSGDRFFVFSFAVEQADPPISGFKDKHITVSGHLYGLTQVRPGIAVQFVGEWIRHPKYGKQFQPYGWFPWATHDMGVQRFLSECIDGFSDAQLVEDVVNVFGVDTYDKLTDEPQTVLKVIPEEAASKRMTLESAILRWSEARSLSSLSIFLQDYELAEDTIREVFAAFGSDAVSFIRENPYRLVAVDGFSFAKADKLAQRVGIGHTDPRRMEGAVFWILKRESKEGHLGVRRGDFEALLKDLIESEHMSGFEGDSLYQQLMHAIERLEKAGSVKVDPEVGVYLPDYYRFERESATKLAKFLTPMQIDIDLSLFLEQYEKSNQIELSEAQREALQKLKDNRVLVLTGGPGTGKTLLVKAMVRLFKQASTSFALMAPTGIAAKRLTAVTGEPAATVHRSLGYDGHVWAFNGRNKFSVGAVIVDEMSMVDQELFFRIVDALDPSTLLILVGDDAQLPSVGPGNVLRELLACSKIPHVRLTQIFRQAAQSEIVVAAHRINQGSAPDLDTKKSDAEFQFVPLQDEDQIVRLIVQMAAKLKSRDANFQVLSPKYEGVVGVFNLNEQIRDQLNPLNGQMQWSAGKLNFREGDRLMVIKNDYKLNVYNGDMGKLISIERESLKVRIHGVGTGVMDTYVDFPKSQVAAMLRLAYVVTVHRSQGAEYGTIVMPVTRSQGRMLQRNLFYTGITRAKSKVWLIGDSSAVYRAVGNNRVVKRNTAFAKSITEAVDSGVQAGESK